MNLSQQIQQFGGYQQVRELGDGTLAGIGKLLFTTAIYLDLEPLGYSRRFCFDDPALAQAQFQALASSDTEPTGWIARR